MSEEIDLSQPCSRCRGTGVEDALSDGQGGTAPGTCVMCNGTGYLVTAKIDVSNINDKLDDIMNKCNDIFEKVDV